MRNQNGLVSGQVDQARMIYLVPQDWCGNSESTPAVLLQYNRYFRCMVDSSYGPVMDPSGSLISSDLPRNESRVKRDGYDRRSSQWDQQKLKWLQERGEPRRQW